MDFRVLGAIWVAATVGCVPIPPQTQHDRSNDLGSVALVVRITAVDNQIPVDGGLSIYAESDSGKRAAFGIGSLYTRPPPPPEVLELYEKLRPLAVGDWVEVSGDAKLLRDEHGDLIAIDVAEVVRVSGPR